MEILIQHSFYALYHKPTGKYMPAKMFRTSVGGHTWWEPFEDNWAKGYQPEIPRLFSTHRAAANSKTLWLKGPHEKYVGSYDPFTDTGEIGGVVVTTSPLPRQEADLEIHQISLRRDY